MHNKYIFFSFEGLSLPIAEKLLNEGKEVDVAFVEDISELGNDEHEDPELKRKRLELFSGIIDKIPASTVMKILPSLENKDDYFIFFDFNNMWKYSEALLKAGFTKGLFPTYEDYTFERDREKAKKFVKKNYPDLRVAEEHSFKTVEEAKQFLEDTEKIWVLKGNSDEAKTIVPPSDDPEKAKDIITGALDKMKAHYESEGFLLEQKIMNPLEMTPQMVFWNGEPVYSDLNIEAKYRDAGDKGIQVGCGMGLLVKTELDNPINKIAFPPAVYEMAKERKGMFVWDASILVDPETKEMFFGEFCPNRVGYDAFLGELAMSGDEAGNYIASPYFEKLVKGENPLIWQYGTTVRLFNEHVSSEGHLKEGIPITVDEKAEPDIYLYRVKKEQDNIVISNYDINVGVATGFSNEDIDDAVRLMYLYADMVSMDGLSYRSDFLAMDYPTAILKRYNYFSMNFKKVTFERGYDFDGVVSEGINPDKESCIITGRTEDRIQEAKDILKERGLENVPIIFNPASKEEMAAAAENPPHGIDEIVGKFKAEKIKEFEIKAFFEDSPYQIEIIKKENPDVKVYEVKMYN